MDYRVMKRPMFKMGGPTSGGTGITSGLETPRQNYQGAGSVMSIEDAMEMGSADIFNKALVPAMLRSEKNYESAMSLPKLQAIGAIASNVLPNVERGGLKGIVDILKDPATINAAIQGLSQTKKLELERDKQKLADLGSIFKGKSAIESSDRAERKLTSDIEYKTESLSIANKKALIKSATQLQAEAGEQSRILLKQNDGSVSNMSEEDQILYYDLRETANGELTPAKARQKAVIIVAQENEAQKKSELDQGKSGKGMDDTELKARIDFLTELLIGTTTQRSDNAEGGRINKQMGGGFDMGQAPQETNLAPMAPQETNLAPQGQDPFTILRSRLPQEISDEVVSLIAYNKKAFADFANIQDQDDVDLFNQKYNVQLVVDLASR